MAEGKKRKIPAVLKHYEIPEDLPHGELVRGRYSLQRDVGLMTLGLNSLCLSDATNKKINPFCLTEVFFLFMHLCIDYYLLILIFEKQHVHLKKNY